MLGMNLLNLTISAGNRGTCAIRFESSNIYVAIRFESRFPYGSVSNSILILVQQKSDYFDFWTLNTSNLLKF